MSQNDQSSQAELNVQQLLTIMTTEHYTLQMGRAGTISDANGRSSLFLNTLSGVLVALGFVGQVSKLDQNFFLFALVLLPSLFFLGLATFGRLVQTAIEDMLYVRGINRIRHYYKEALPDMRDYFILSDRDDGAGMMQNMGSVSSRFQLFLTNAGMISVINSVLVGVLVALILGYTLSLLVWLCVAGGLIVFVVSLACQYFYQVAKWNEVDKHLKVMFPSRIA